MSQIFGAWQYYASKTQEPLEKMYGPMRAFLQVNLQSKIHQQTGFGYLSSYNALEPVYKTLPVFLQEEQVLFTAQGRIDNRAEISQYLNLKITDTDETFILKAWLLWGKNSVHKLKGEWSFAVFDYNAQELFIGRDTMGYTSIYYYIDESGFYFSSSLKSILGLPNYKKDLNEAHFIEKLTLWKNADHETPTHTFYQKIFSLPNAHTLTVKNKAVSINKYWQPQSIPLRHYKNKQDYVDEMLELLTSAVKARLRSDRAVASMLSGGLDSSTVSYIAAELLKTQNTPLTTLSHVPLFAAELLKNEQRHRSMLDETPFVKEVARASGNLIPHFI